VKTGGLAILGVLLAAASPATARAADPIVLTNHLGYDVRGPKRAVVQGHTGDEIRSCDVVEADTGVRAAAARSQYVGPVARWRDWVYWTLDFTDLQREGTFRLACTTATGEIASASFRLEQDLLERHTLSDVLYYFKGQRSSGLLDQADRALSLEGQEGASIDAHGGWYDATGDYGKHLSHLSFATYFNPQQLPFTAWGLLETYDLLQRRGDPLVQQYLRRLADEAAWGADYLVRVKAPGGSFYRSVSAPGPAKRPQDRVIGREARGMNLKGTKTEESFVRDAGGAADQRMYQSSLRAGGGVAIAALARAAALQVPGERAADYLRAAEEAWSFLAANNVALTNDGQENIVDDYCALLAASELYGATRKAGYRVSAEDRAQRVLDGLVRGRRAYWRAAS